MDPYGWLFAACYDRLLAGLEREGLTERRRSLLSGASGRVVEIGAGTGLNLAHYPAEAGPCVLTEPDEPMVRKLEQRLAATGRSDDWVVRAPAERLPFQAAAFDTAVTTLVLCTVRRPERAALELRRVLKPGGTLLFIEHVRSPTPAVRRLQDLLNPLQRAVGRGCNCNRETASILEGAGFELHELERFELTGAPPFIRPAIAGRARLAAAEAAV